MPRRAAPLAPINVKRLPPGRYGDGGGLYLSVKPPGPRHQAAGQKDGGRFWIFRYVVEGRTREAGLGPVTGPNAVSLADAREKAAELRKRVRVGVDPLAEREAAVATEKASKQAAAARAVTFRDVTTLYLAAHEAGWRSAKHRAQWETTLEVYAYPHMGSLPVGEVTTAHVMAALEPIWHAKPETASRVRGRIEAVLDYATARSWRTGENPARWRGHVAHMLPRRTEVQPPEHHAALLWSEIGSFMAQLRGEEGMAALALQFAILTAGRTGEVLGAKWPEIDLSEAVWNVPAARMKAKREHRVPLSEPAVALLRTLLPLRDAAAGDWVFPGAKAGKPLSGMAMLMLLRRMGRADLTAHGFRLTFRDWCSESTSYSRDVAEMALAHSVRDKVEAAYRRGDLFDKRRRLMADWAAFCARPASEGGSVTPIRGTG